MDGCLDNVEEYMGLSSNSGDSNALILPCKKKKKAGNTKNTAKVQIGKGKKLTKSQKRKLRKSEEEEEQKKMLSKSLEILEKCKINKDVYKLLWSSRSLGQAETSKEKRRRIMQFSQAGLEYPYPDSRTKTQFSDDNSSISETEDEAHPPQGYEDRNTFMKPLVVQKEAIKENSRLLDSSLQPICEDEVEGNKISCTKSLIEENSEEHVQLTGVTGGALSSNSSSCSMKENSTTVDDIGDTPRDTFGCTKSVVNLSSQAAPSVPTVVHVSRPEEVESKRKDLPIVMMEQEIMEKINENISVIICGETGCGKTTQVPQFLYEVGFGSKLCSTRSGVIGVTQPRRVAVLATAKRVAFELGLRLGREVGFQVRYDRRIGENCAIKFMTDGILLREVQGDFLLKRYSVIILDEAHERSLNTDILIGMLSRVIRQRQAIYEEQQKKALSGETIDPEARIFPLKLILMSATLKVEDFTFGGRIFREPPPVIEVPTRQYPVTTHFAKRTELLDYIGQAYKKVLSIHKNLPPGGILVFVTGQREVENLCDKLRKASKDLVKKSSRVDRNEVSTNTNLNEIDGYDMKEITDALEVNDKSTQQQTYRFSLCDEPDEEAGDEESDFSYHSSSESDVESESDTDHMHAKDPEADDDLAEALGQNGSLEALKAAFAALSGKTAPKPEFEGKQKNSATADGCCNEPEPSLTEKKKEKDKLVGPMCVLPLYAMLPAADQLRVFGKVKEGERIVIVATNVAETSLTIPGIKYVVDTGREKVKNYNSSNGIESYEIQWISKASASQRAGRAGRTGPGHCYRLYSSTVFSNFDDFSFAEILKIPVEGVVLLMKSMGIGKVANFPFPTPPDVASLVEAERCLKALEALDHEGRLTSLGKTMSRYPMSPRHSRMLLTAIQVMNKNKHYVRSNLVLGYAVAAAAALSVSNPFVLQFQGSLGKSDSQEQDGKSGPPEDQKAAVKQHKSMRKKLKETAKISRAKFSNIKSDALTVAYALQCYELAHNQSEFCTHYALRHDTMKEMSKLRTQLLHLVFPSSDRGLEQEYVWSEGTLQDVEDAWRVPSDEKNPLSKTEEDVLLGAICSGWVDRVAKRVSRAHQSPEGDKTVNAVSYQASMVEEKVYLHRWSSVSKSAPEFLVYSELLHTKRPYIHGASGVESEWLVRYARSLCTFSAPLTDPKPGYDHHTDQVYCHVIPYFGPHSWELPYHKAPIDDVVSRVTVFAYALLDGQVLPCLKPVRKFMAAQPSMILKRESLGEKRVGNLLSKLNSRSRTIDNCVKLKEAWMKSPMELYAEIRSWFQAGFHDHFDGLWAKMQSEALLSPQDRFSHKSKKRKNLG